MAETEAAPPWEPPLSGTEVEHLLGALDRQRATFRWKADGRGRAGLTTTVGASTVTLGGLLKHLALVEDVQSTVKLTGEPLGEPWTSMPGMDGPHLEWTAADDEPAFLYALYDAAVERSRARFAAAVADGGLNQRVHLGSDQGLVTSLRRLLFDLLEEYGRHTGHADLLSEAVDGRVGEDPPPDWVPVGAVDDGEGHEPAVPRFEQRRMLGATSRAVDLTGAEFTYVDLDGATFRGANLRRVTISGSDLVDVTITAGDLENVVINDVDVVPLVDAELDRRDPERPLVHPSDADGFRRGWDLLERRWAETVARARALPPERLHDSVEGEWSFVQTLRHLVFATQSWVGRGVLGDPTPWHPLALPWDEAPDDWNLPRDREVRPNLDEVLAVRAESQAMVRRVLDDLTDAQLDTVPEVVVDGPWPPAGETVRQCLSVVLDEEYAHRLFAERDLALLESRPSGDV
ncbi:mycothiol transferase [Microlunatus antarcticus]|uniref:Uncharacterized protein YjbI with pentapeptide repeats n=1 Tax=Microlunatus antarcticus TaxID=53388 RepID=A0A7W5P9D9_9ACTN|nr:DUF664 domain-containing protein [Microlunatus antarcticus]MBB3328821.1 uncharacterized protein YjbI with pentapeptide repeats [Microlunatus antarcticus]